MNKRLSVAALALSVVVAGVAWRGALQKATQMDGAVLSAQGSRPAPPIPPPVPPQQPPQQ
jgi:hypothetical protein